MIGQLGIASDRTSQDKAWKKESAATESLGSKFKKPIVGVRVQESRQDHSKSIAYTFEPPEIRIPTNFEVIFGDRIAASPIGPTKSLHLCVGVSRTSGVAFVHEDFVGSKREMSANRARHFLLFLRTWADLPRYFLSGVDY